VCLLTAPRVPVRDDGRHQAHHRRLLHGDARLRLRALLGDAGLAPFQDEDLRTFLERWFVQYEVMRAANNPPARERGLREAGGLARDILANPQVRTLAGNPLMLMVLAIVHRAGTRLGRIRHPIPTRSRRERYWIS
jgi:predicted NACHT family NTPase